MRYGSVRVERPMPKFTIIVHVCVHRYQNGDVGATRTTQFTYIDATQTLSWTVTNNYHGVDVYTTAELVLFTQSGTVVTRTGKLGVAGSVTFKSSATR